MSDGTFKIGKCYLATNCMKKEDKRIVAVTDRQGSSITFALVSGVVTGYVDETDVSGEFASNVFIDDMPFVVPSSISPSLSELHEANEAMRKSRAAV